MAQTTPRPTAQKRPRKTSLTAPEPRSRHARRPASISTRRPRVRKTNRVGRLLSVILLGICAGLAMYGGYVYHHSDALQRYLPVLFRHGLRQPTAQEAFGGRPNLNLLIIGRDADYSDADQLLKSNGRSDMLMVGRLDFPQHQVTLLSIPRDTRAHIPGHGMSKINSAHKWGGPSLTAQTVQANFGIPSQQFVALDFAGFEKAIDMLGGVDLTVDKKMDYDDNWGHLHIHLKPGPQHLNGQEAMGFVRFRHSDNDLIRVQRQQTLLAALKAKLYQPQTLAMLPQLLDMLDAHLTSDLTTEQKLALARFVHDTPRGQIQMTTLPSRAAGAAVATNWPLAGPLIQRIFHVAPRSMASAGGRSRHAAHRWPRMARRP